MPENILDAIYGSLIAGAIGDALGAPVEGMYWSDIREKYGRMTDIYPSAKGNTGPCYGCPDGFSYGEKHEGPTPKAGWFSDDTTMRHYACLAIVRKGGRITPNEYRDTLLDVFNPNRVWVNERSLFYKLRAGVNPWDSGLGQIPAGCATMQIAPIGIINAGNPRQAYQDGFNIAFMNQQGHNRDGAATFAAGVAAAFLPGATVETVLQAMTDHTTYHMARAIELTMDMAMTSSDVDDFAEKYYDKLLDWSWPSPPENKWNKERFFSGNSIELVPITMAMLYFTNGDPHQAMIEAASFGRDCDSTASMAGSITGILHGASAIRSDWIETVESANIDFYEEVEGDPNANFHSMAVRMVAALRNESRAARDRSERLAEILGEMN